MRSPRLIAVSILGSFVLVSCSSHPALNSFMSSQGLAEHSAIARGERTTSGYGTIDEYTVPKCPKKYRYNCSPNDIALGLDKRMWFGNQVGGAIDSIDLSGSIRVHEVDDAQGLFNFDVAEASDRTMWFTAGNISQGFIGHLAHGSVTLYSVPPSTFFITRGFRDMWFSAENSIGKISPTGAVTVFSMDPNSNPGDLVRGPDGNIWFTDGYFGSPIQSRVGKITPSGKTTEFVVPDKTPGGIIGITVGPDGNLWFTDGSVTNGITQIGSCTLNGSITMYDTPTTHATAWGITSGPSNDLYFTETGVNRIGHVTLNPVQITEYIIPPPANPLGIGLGADNNIWFTIPGVNLIGKFHTH